MAAVCGWDKKKGDGEKEVGTAAVCGWDEKKGDGEKEVGTVD